MNANGELITSEQFRPPLSDESSAWAAWPARDGADGLNPSVSGYPSNMKTWMICGPFDLREVDKFEVVVDLWFDLDDSGDSLFIGTSTDNEHFYGPAPWTGPLTSDWIRYHIPFNSSVGNQYVWVGVLFESDDDMENVEGAWVDNLEIWRYTLPETTCGDLDSGNKGVVLKAYERQDDKWYPVIRYGDTWFVAGLIAADASWLRTVFEQQRGIIQYRDYDRIVDTLCAYDISVLGILNHESLLRQDYNSDDSSLAEAYRQEFSNTAEYAAQYFQGRMKYWEVWNEPDLGEEHSDPPFVRPTYYAQLLESSYQALKQGEPNSQVLFGALASAWDPAYSYFDRVYAEWSGDVPFDYFAIHPYFNDDPRAGLDPVSYMYYNVSSPETTILDKFLRLMYDQGDGNKTIWVTELGWNSAQTQLVTQSPVADLVTTEREQAQYLKSGFDILFNEVNLWGTSTPAIEKLIWYQYRDIGGVYWGLYREDKRTTKPSWCAFSAYPNDCHSVFLPSVTRSATTQ